MPLGLGLLVCCLRGLLLRCRLGIRRGLLFGLRRGLRLGLDAGSFQRLGPGLAGRLLGGLGAGARFLFFGRLPTRFLGREFGVFVGGILNRVGQQAHDQADRPNGIVVAGDGEVDQLGVAIGVDQGDDRDLQPIGLGHRNAFAVDIHQEHRPRQLLHVRHPAQIALQLDQLAAQLRAFLLGCGDQVAAVGHLSL